MAIPLTFNAIRFVVDILLRSQVIGIDAPTPMESNGFARLISNLGTLTAF